MLIVTQLCGNTVEDKSKGFKMISKELLSEVLKRRCKIVEIEQYENELWWRKDLDCECSDQMEINIYELAHKCKEWAWTNGFEVYRGYDSISIIRKSDESLMHEMYADGLDPKYDIEACQWILDNKDKQ